MSLIPSLPSPAPTPDNSLAIPSPNNLAHIHLQANGGATDPQLDPNNTEVDPYPELTAESEQRELRSDVERKLLKLAQDLYEMEVCAGDVAAGQEHRVPNYLREINRSFVELSAMSTRMTDSVPHQVIEHIDNYKNPHLYTKTTLSRATGENQYTLGRVLGLESFRRQLEDALGKEFPDVPLPSRRHIPIRPVEEVAQNHEDVAAPGEEERVKVEMGMEVNGTTTGQAAVPLSNGS